MKKWVTILFLFMATHVMAQDVIVLKTGELIQTKVQEINEKEIKYKKFSNLNGPLYIIGKGKVLCINYENGEREMMDTVAEPSEVSTEKNNNQPLNEIGIPDVERNKSLIALINGADIRYNGGKKNKKAKAFLCKYSVTEDSEMANKDIELQLSTGSAPVGLGKKEGSLDCRNRWVSVSVKNKTSKTIYIDLANTFFKRGDESFPFFTASSTSTTNIGSSGVSVNMGAVTGALGIGGSVGALANGINLGGSKSKAATTTVYEQRILAIPPMSTKELEEQYLFTQEYERYYTGVTTVRYNPKVGSDHTRIEIDGELGGDIEWDEESSLVRNGLFVTYSTDENFTCSASVNINMYISKATGINWLGANSTGGLKDFSDAPKEMIFFIARKK